ncbi:predicted protein [Botrytis cinerea T4]|uniref:Uncharacterized protein n=1 Tax=Botryotinia fuckeliana (strain T4) TaxID=999810 RepID=G2XWA6_BOTF4|nr:predicted protein [Botrytis cinerea T4]
MAEFRFANEIYEVGLQDHRHIIERGEFQPARKCELAVGCGSHAYLQAKQALSSHTKHPQNVFP